MTNSSPGSSPGGVVVIGYGNPLRGDDGAGVRVAEEVAGWGWPHVRALGVHQLTPELAEALAGARLAVFVDARPAREGETISVEPLEPAGEPAVLDHASDPRFLLGLTRALHGSHLPAWWLTVPGLDFGLG